MDISSINSDLIRGNVTTIILKALWEDDRYGYDILREIEIKSQGQYKLKQPTLYSCLKRLEKQGLISSYWGDESDTEGGRRRYYSLTEAGRSFVSKMQSEYEFSRTILDKLLSEKDFDFESNPAPFDINGLRPYTKRRADGDDEDNNPMPSYSDDDEKQNSPTSTSDETQIKNDTQNSMDIHNDQASKAYTYHVKGSSYDESVRTTKKSMSEMLSAINQIVENKDTVSSTIEKTVSAEKDDKPETVLETPIIPNTNQ